MLVGVENSDAEQDARLAAEKIAGLRVFPDQDDRMNLSVLDVSGEALVVSQFTLVADITRGRRPSFDAAGDPTHARRLVDVLIAALEDLGVPVAQGRFGARMVVDLVNDGPVTILFDVRDGRII